MIKPNETLRILLAEDNEGDAILLQKRFSQSPYPHEMIIVEDGEEALEVLSNSVPRPHIIILDINMPKLNGIEALSKIKQDSKLANIPVLMLTSSQYTEDIEAAKKHGANGYINKPGDVDTYDLVTFLGVVKSNPKVWMQLQHK